MAAARLLALEQPLTRRRASPNQGAASTDPCRKGPTRSPLESNRTIRGKK
jgi:hypothetical protein